MLWRHTLIKIYVGICEPIEIHIADALTRRLVYNTLYMGGDRIVSDQAKSYSNKQYSSLRGVQWHSYHQSTKASTVQIAVEQIWYSFKWKCFIWSGPMDSIAVWLSIQTVWIWPLIQGLTWFACSYLGPVIVYWWASNFEIGVLNVELFSYIIYILTANGVFSCSMHLYKSFASQVFAVMGTNYFLNS